jgi:hypothetical protein
MTENISDEEAAELGLQIINTPGGLDALERQGIQNLTTAVKELSRDLAQGKVPPEVRELVEYVVMEGKARLAERGTEMPGVSN